MDKSRIKEFLIILKYDLDNLYNKAYNENYTNKTLLKKYYDNALMQLNNEINFFKENKGKYDKSIYVNNDLLNKKLNIELKRIVDSCKYNISKMIKDIRIEMIENEINEKDELNAENFLEDISAILDLGIVGMFGGKISYF